MFLKRCVLTCLSNKTANVIFIRALQSSACMQTKVAVVLSGCGVYDGSEIHESSAVLVHLSRAGANVTMFAPDIPQMHTINHTNGEKYESNRNVLEESARIARGKVQTLSNLNTQQYDAVIFPGGFGAAKNLSTFAVDGSSMKVNPDVSRILSDFHFAKKPIGSTFAVDGSSMKVNPDVSRILSDFHFAKKPIGLCCIAPVLAAKVIKGCEVTVGSDQEEGGKWPHTGTVKAIEDLGAKHKRRNVTEIHTDEKNKIVTTPAYMCETALHEIFDGIGAMVTNVLKMIK